MSFYSPPEFATAYTRFPTVIPKKELKVLPSPPPSPYISRKEVDPPLFEDRGNELPLFPQKTFTHVWDLYRKNPRRYLRIQRAQLQAYRRQVPRRERTRRHMVPQARIVVEREKPRVEPPQELAFDQLPDFAPPLSTLKNMAKPLRVEWKGAPLDLSQDPHRHLLHPTEVALASTLRLTCGVYLDSKRRIFAEKHARKKRGLPFLRTNAQQCTHIDVNKASRLWVAFDRVGWFDA